MGYVPTPNRMPSRQKQPDTTVSNFIDNVQNVIASYGVKAQDASKALDMLNAAGNTPRGGISGERVKLQSKFEVVTELPEIGTGGTIYLIEKDGVYEEWMWIEKEPRWYANNISYFTGGEWTKIGTITPTEEEPETPKMRPTNCKNCGAPLENGKCKYCGTEY